MTDELTTVKRHADAARRHTAQRDTAIRDARDAGHTWRAIALAAQLTEAGCRKIAARADTSGG